MKHSERSEAYPDGSRGTEFVEICPEREQEFQEIFEAACENDEIDSEYFIEQEKTKQEVEKTKQEKQKTKQRTLDFEVMKLQFEIRKFEISHTES